jgi:hypothetical protein
LAFSSSAMASFTGANSMRVIMGEGYDIFSPRKSRYEIDEESRQVAF